MVKNEDGRFSETAVAEIAYMRETIENLFEQVIKAYTNKDSESLQKAYEIEDNVDHITKRMGENHIIRLNSGICTALVGTQYMSLASNSERIADHLVNVGKMINEWWLQASFPYLEKQKIAIARALAGEAKLMLFDEPTANLDLKGQYETIGLIRSLKDKGVSVLISMHDINHALDVGDNFIVLKDKKVLCSGNEEIMTPSLLHEVYGMDFEMVEHGNKKHFHIKGDHEHDE